MELSGPGVGVGGVVFAFERWEWWQVVTVCDVVWLLIHALFGHVLALGTFLAGLIFYHCKS